MYFKWTSDNRRSGRGTKHVSVFLTFAQTRSVAQGQPKAQDGKKTNRGASIINRVLIDQTCFGRSGGLGPISLPLRGCDVVALKVEDVAPSGYTIERATVRQRKTGRPVKFELTEQTRQATEDYLRASAKKPGEFLFPSRRKDSGCMTTRQYARLVADWIGSIGLDPRLFGTHSLRRTKATLIYRRTGNLRPSSSCSATPRSRARCAISGHRGRRRARDSGTS